MPATAPVALVTGGAVRIGRAICRSLAATGHRVAIHHRSSGDAARELCDELRADGADARVVRADLTDPAATVALAQEVEAAFGRVDVLVNNASVFPATPLLSTSTEDLVRAVDITVALHIVAPLLLVRALAPGMTARGAGTIVNLGDSVTARAGHAAYAASKAGLLSLTRSLARELAPEVRVNMVSPGAILPAPGEDSAQSAATFARVVAKIPMGRAGTPEEVAAAVLFFATGPAIVTGQVLAVAGGRG